MATFTLASTTFAAKVLEADTQVLLTSTSGIVPGVFLYIEQELMVVDRLTGISTLAVVRRGIDGTKVRAHAAGVTVWIGAGFQFYQTDPQGLPPSGGGLVNPHINVLTGGVWMVQGDVYGAGMDGASWQLVTTTQAPGALGVRVTTVTNPS